MDIIALLNDYNVLPLRGFLLKYVLVARFELMLPGLKLVPS
jgi:hypothetical protein